MVRLAIAVGLAFCVSAAPAVGGGEAFKPVLIEAEAFEDLGGWVVDQQFMDQMGSPMLLAHGLGFPVADAVTRVELPKTGKYRVWVRTRDWAAPWKTGFAPGKFQLVVDGRPLDVVLGTEGAEWHWQDGGEVEIANKRTTLGLHDLTGFDGRCDAILLSPTSDYVPTNDPEALASMRRALLGLSDEPEDAGRFDLVVVGGGMAGTCAAISAARLGLQVALIQDRPVLGGNNSSEVRVHLMGKTGLAPYPALGAVVSELDPGPSENAAPAEKYDDQKKLRIVRAEKNLRLFLNMHACRVEKQGERITSVIARHIRTGKELRLAGVLFADCTGDGAIGHLAGAEYRYGREGRSETGEPLAVEKADRTTLGTSVMWYSVETEEASRFPECPWAIEFCERNYQRAVSGDWDWETGFAWDQMGDFEKIRDHGLRAVYGNWAFQKNRCLEKEKYAKRRLGWVAYIGGKRESRRLLGDVILQQQDIDERRPYPDACVTATWTIDLHYAAKSEEFPGEEFRSVAKFHRTEPYAIPYRCLYSRNVNNLFMAGRNISVTHVALGMVRVQRTTGMMGEVVGMAAAVCRRHEAMPREVYGRYFDELRELMTRGAGASTP